MAYFASAQPTKKLTLPSNKNYWIEIYTNMRWGQSKAFFKSDENGKVDMVASADGYLLALIKAWNLDGDNGDVAPINAAYVDQLSRDDALFILTEAGEAVEDPAAAKKN